MNGRDKIGARQRGLFACTGALALAASACGAGNTASKPEAPSNTASKPEAPPSSFEALDKELDKCPLKEADTNLGQKQAASERIECLRKRLDEVLVPLKGRDPQRFEAMMTEQAEWNRFITAACDLEEERSWTRFDTGERFDGTLRSYARMGCLDAAYSERILYARAMAADDPKPIAGRIDATRQKGLDMEKALDDVKQKAEAFQKKPPTLPPNAHGEGDWKGIADKASEVRTGAAALAQATCDGWSALVAKLGPKEGCVSKLTLYYYAQAGRPEASY